MAPLPFNQYSESASLGYGTKAQCYLGQYDATALRVFTSSGDAGADETGKLV